MLRSSSCLPKLTTVRAVMVRAAMEEKKKVTLPRQALPGTHTRQSSSLARNHLVWARPRNMRWEIVQTKVNRPKFNSWLLSHGWTRAAERFLKLTTCTCHLSMFPMAHSIQPYPTNHLNVESMWFFYDLPKSGNRGTDPGSSCLRGTQSPFLSHSLANHDSAVEENCQESLTSPSQPKVFPQSF